MESTEIRAISRREELANVATHGIGALLSIVALRFLLYEGFRLGTPRAIVGLGVFGLSLFILYSLSTLYHWMRDPAVKRLFRILDHSSIYVLIAGSYTAVALVFVGGPAGWLIVGLEWGFALLGIAFKLFFIGRLKIISVLFYLAMGWLAVVFWRPLSLSLTHEVLLWIVAGGVSYTLGVLFFALKRMPYHHGVWHLFVIFGSLCHFLGIYLGAAQHS